MIVPQNGDFSSSEGVSFTQYVGPSNAILGAWAVTQASGGDSSADDLTTTGTGPYRLAVASYNNGFSGADGTMVVSVTGSSSLNQDTSVFAPKLCGSSNTTLARPTR